MKSYTLLMVGTIICGLSGCSTFKTTEVQAYSGVRLPADRVAVIEPQNAQILLVDGTAINEKCGVDAKCKLSLLEGKHSVQVQPMALGGGGSPGYIGATSATPAMTMSSSYRYTKSGSEVTLRYPFSAGHEYTLLGLGGGAMTLIDKTAHMLVTGE